MPHIDSLIACGDLLPICLVVADMHKADAPAIYVNQPFRDLTGYSNSEILEKNFRILQGKLSSEKAKKRIRDAIESRQAIHQDIINYKKSGEPFWNRMVLVPFMDLGHLYYFGIQMDVTERKKAIIGKPLTVLSLEEASHHEICHNIRNSLNVLVVGQMLQKEREASGPQTELVQHMKRAIENIATYVEQLSFDKSF
jgi:PAS domain S-box-containing protein